MPWKANTVEKTRAAFVQQIQAREKSKSALCREYGISRPTGDKWIHRAEEGEGFSDHSHRPFKTPANKLDPKIEEMIIAARKEMPGIGAVKIKRILENAGKSGLPCHSTVNAVFKRNQLITREASEAASPNQRFEQEKPNIMWQADFKGHFELGNGERCHPLSILDDHSRYCLCADAKTNERREDTQASFERVFKEYGQPSILLCDNGNPWGASQSGGYSSFEVWLMEHDILVMHIRARHPKTQGKVERFNGAYKAERLKYHVPADMEEAMQDRLAYQHFHNHIRPHHALDLDVPAKHYFPSDVPFCESVGEWGYSEDCILRTIKHTGFLSFEGQGYYFSEAFRHKVIALRRSISNPNIVNLYFRKFWIGQLNVNDRMIVSRKAYLIVDDPRFSKNTNEVVNCKQSPQTNCKPSPS